VSHPTATDRRDDEALMRRAVAQADHARLRTSPRPRVGAWLEPAGVGGHTFARAHEHAEVAALREAGGSARGATLYVTLEPCSHQGRTPPCVDAVLDAGVVRVVVGLEDPDPQVSGQGIARLREAGVEVVTGVCAAEIEAQLAPYLHHRRTGRPLVVLKLAATLDGRTAAPDGTSQWITGDAARQDAHRLRAESDAVLVGAGTVRDDDPSLTVRLPGLDVDQPLRVVLGRAPADARVQPALELAGELDEILDELGRRGVLQVLVEGGASVAGAFHRAGLVDRYVVYLAPALFGGDDGRPLLAGPGAPTIDALWRGRIAEVRRLDEDLRVDVVPNPVEAGGEASTSANGAVHPADERVGI
jgi:diaminohydroxyphosphoribosylaminopyrimidine deaminase/5-amino-6-(5-phosphoribosylamino)uracil reductase